MPFLVRRRVIDMFAEANELGVQPRISMRFGMGQIPGVSIQRIDFHVTQCNTDLIFHPSHEKTVRRDLPTTTQDCAIVLKNGKPFTHIIDAHAEIEKDKSDHRESDIRIPISPTQMDWPAASTRDRPSKEHSKTPRQQFAPIETFDMEEMQDIPRATGPVTADRSPPAIHPPAD